MRNMKASKLITAILVLAMVLSTMAILPSKTVQGADGASISFNVIDSGSDPYPIEDAYATLEEVHTGKEFSTTTDSSGLATFSPWSGYYELTISKNGYFDNVYSSIIRYDGLSSVNLGQIQMTSVPAKDYWLNVSVYETGTSNLIDDVTLTATDTDTGYQVYDATQDGEFNFSVYPSDWKLEVTSSGYAKNVTTVAVSGDMNTSMEMDNSISLRGWVYMDGSPITSGLEAYLISKNDSLDVQKRIVMPRTASSNYFRFDAYPGQFSLIVKASGTMANITDLNITTSKTITVNLTEPQQQSDQYSFEFDASDWNHFNLTREYTYNFDQTIPAMAYSYLPNIRMQIDFALGDSDGVVNATEVGLFEDKMTEFGPLNVTTEWLMQINGTSFVADSGSFSFASDGLAGDVNDSAPFSATLETSYTSISSIDVGAEEYTGTSFVMYDKSAIDRSYTMDLPDNYELVDNETETSSVSVSGYTTVSIEPGENTGIREEVSLSFEESLVPSAVAGIVSSDSSYEVLDNSTLLYYIVKNGTEVNFTSDGSYDPNGNPLTYQWDFGDGAVESTDDEVISHVYTETVFNLTVNLTVIDVAGLEDSHAFEVKVDGIEPVPSMYVDGEEVLAGESISVDQNEALTFNGEHSFDYINSTDEDPPAGIITSWHWDFGDGNTTTVLEGEEPNVTHAYAQAGTYSVVLNATDSVGHYRNMTITVEVQDVTPPTISFVILNSEYEDIRDVSPVENETLYFDASETYDNYDQSSELEFFWEFGDGTNDTGVNVTHNYSAIGEFTVKLTVTDTSGNSANDTDTITVVSSPRPDLRISSITVDPAELTEGETGMIKVNITNVGNANATGIRANFYLMKADGSKEKIGESSSLTVNGVDSNILQPDQSGIISFDWKAGGKGNFTIYSEVMSDREINMDDNADTVSISVEEAGWVSAAIYGGVFAVIVAIIILFYMRKRLPILGGKRRGRRRK